MLDFRSREKPSAPAQGGRRLRGGRIQMCSAFVRGDWRSAVGSAALSMNPIQTFHSKLRGLATMLDSETPRLLRALDGEDCGEWARAGGRESAVLGGRCFPLGEADL